jgi:hypothetical protein
MGHMLPRVLSGAIAAAALGLAAGAAAAQTIIRAKGAQVLYSGIPRHVRTLKLVLIHNMIRDKLHL